MRDEDPHRLQNSSNAGAEKKTDGTGGADGPQNQGDKVTSTIFRAGIFGRC